ncbi:N-acetylglucosamine kinase [Herbidospora mongoliensis]|uniref:N-acetylglucosamine kinase n=1 Tax=Herbidospora mongoliensis TaxID=688067 RepID=UPI00082E3C4F|nr:BadF/BadG/BcrA/BcrD ATPase family protein [Herbidospora mongoliensis]
MRTILAIDGGNSKTDIALIREDGLVERTWRGGPFTPQSSGVAAAIDVIEIAVGPGPYADHVFAYVAGADLPIEEVRLRDEMARRGFAPEIVVGNDTFALLRAGASGPWGAAVVCGAGINAVAVGPDGRVARFPALGRLSGDWGGGGGIAEEALWHAARAEDGRGPATALAGVVRRVFGTATVEEAVIALHFGDLAYERLHDLVAPLLETARAGDVIACEVITRLADEIAVLGIVAMRRIDLLDIPCEVVLGGGVLTARDPLLTELIEARYTAGAPHAKLVVADVPPIVGAAFKGLDALNAAPEAYDRVRAAF